MVLRSNTHLNLDACYDGRPWTTHRAAYSRVVAPVTHPTPHPPKMAPAMLHTYRKSPSGERSKRIGMLRAQADACAASGSQPMATLPIWPSIPNITSQGSGRPRLAGICRFRFGGMDVQAICCCSNLPPDHEVQRSGYRSDPRLWRHHMSTRQWRASDFEVTDVVWIREQSCRRQRAASIVH